jgi:hypothetical protein
LAAKTALAATPMTAACIGPEAAIDVLKDALSY